MMSADGFSQYIIGSATSLISASDLLESGCFDNSLLGQNKMLLTIDCDTDQIRQEHLDEFNQTLSRQQWCHTNTNTKFRVPNQCWTVSHHRDGTVSLDGLQLHKQPLIQNCIRRRTHYWQSDNVQRINNLPNHISAKIYSWQVWQRFFSTTTDEDGSHNIWLIPIACTCIAWSDVSFPKENVSL